jgi:transposase
MGKERRSFSSEFKFTCVLSLLSGEKSMAQLCREHGICESVIGRWRDQFMERGQQVFESREGSDSAQEQRIAELERLVGQLTVQLEAGKKASSWLKCQ